MPTEHKTRAMIDMAAAFGHGARLAPVPLKWEEDAAKFAETWLEDRLKKSKKDYWTDKGVRADALQRAFEVGIVVASSAKDGVITVADIKKALGPFGFRRGPGPRDYCPF